MQSVGSTNVSVGIPLWREVLCANDDIYVYKSAAIALAEFRAASPSFIAYVGKVASTPLDSTLNPTWTHCVVG